MIKTFVLKMLLIKKDVE